MFKVQVVVQTDEPLDQINDEIQAVATKAGVPCDLVVPGWQSTGETPPTIRSTFGLFAVREHPERGATHDWLKTGLKALLATYEALPSDSPQRKLGKQVGSGWVGGSNRLDGQPHDVCAEIRALLAS